MGPHVAIPLSRGGWGRQPPATASNGLTGRRDDRPAQLRSFDPNPADCQIHQRGAGGIRRSVKAPARSGPFGARDAKPSGEPIQAPPTGMP